MVTFDEIKTDYPLRAIVEEHLGQPARDGADPFWLCPFHQDTRTPNFHLQPCGTKYRCFQCGESGDVVDFIERRYNVETGEAINILTKQSPIPMPTNPKPIPKKAPPSRKEAFDRIATMKDRVDWYHSQLNDQAMAYWHSEGLTDQSIEYFQVGYAPECPIHYPGSGESKDSYVIPSFWGERVISIRHRLVVQNGRGKYRPEFKGLPAVPFNLNSLKQDEINFSLMAPGEVLVIEGEKKAMVVWQNIGGAVLGLPGSTSWQDHWGHPDTGIFTGYHRAYVMMDKDVKQPQLERIAKGIKQSVRQVLICTIPCKPDDFFVKHGFTVERFLGYLEDGVIYD